MTDPHTTETFEGWDSFWLFRSEFSRHSRFIRSEKSERFLRAGYLLRPHRQIEEDRIFWRAQLGHDWQLEEKIGEEVPGAPPRS